MTKKHTIEGLQARLIQSHLDDKADTLDDFSTWLERQMNQAIGDVSQASRLADLSAARTFLLDFKYRDRGGK
jgi:hypothetical protein